MLRVGQFRLDKYGGPYTLEVHATEAGEPSCSTRWVDTWNGKQMIFASWNGTASEVTCGHCLKKL